ncbi:hypothetical protein IHI24_000919 [Rickettsia endosymbiont of Cardiosporidium cionae]|nr:hypothetical protein IHI24_000919 [Rickettsia endosymbiont of Cardiosporidium cionae]
MLNEVLRKLNKRKFFNHLGGKETINFVKEILEIGFENDCNNGEILDKIGRILKFCYYCQKPAEEMGEDTDIYKKCIKDHDM